MTHFNRNSYLLPAGILAFFLLLPQSILANSEPLPQGLGATLEKSLHSIEADSIQAGQYSNRNLKQGLQLGFNTESLRVQPLMARNNSSETVTTAWDWVTV